MNVVTLTLTFNSEIFAKTEVGRKKFINEISGKNRKTGKDGQNYDLRMDLER